MSQRGQQHHQQSCSLECEEDQLDFVFEGINSSQENSIPFLCFG